VSLPSQTAGEKEWRLLKAGSSADQAKPSLQAEEGG